MKKEHISDALNMLNDDIIEETNNVRTNAKPKRKWVKCCLLYTSCASTSVWPLPLMSLEMINSRIRDTATGLVFCSVRDSMTRSCERSSKPRPWSRA